MTLRKPPATILYPISVGVIFGLALLALDEFLAGALFLGAFLLVGVVAVRRLRG